MRIFEEGGPLDPVEEEKRAAEPEDLRAWRAPEASGRSRGIFLLFLIDLVLAGLSGGAVWWLFGARRYLLNDSAEFGTEMADALVGLRVMTIAAGVLAGGFLLSALGVLSLSRLGYRVQMLWALLLCVTLVGLPYAIPVLLYLRRSETHARFFA